MHAPLPVHSSRGASSMERWATCPGSINLIKSLPPQLEKADPEYRTEGSAAHEAAAYCLTGSLPEPWELIGQKFGDVPTEITTEIADAIQVFVDECDELSAGAITTYVEAHLKDPDNPWCYGTVDFAAVFPGLIRMRDYKHGQGIVVITRDNPQMLYYAYLLLLLHPDVRQIEMRICQPRIPHEPEEPWIVSAEYVMEWAEKVMIPAALRTETDNTLCSGEHCRFCDAKEGLACPVLKQETAAVLDLDPTTIVGMADEDLLVMWPKIDTVKMHLKAIGDEAMRRLMAGGMKENTVVKLVHKKANRVWKAEAPAVFQERFGAKVMNPPVFKSPAEMEKIDATAKKMVHEYAYTPQSGYTLAPADDKRVGVVVKTATETFKAVLDTVE